MAIPSVTDVLSGAAALLADSAQEQYTNSVLLPFYSIVYRQAADLAARWGTGRAKSDAYYALPANTTVMIPSVAGITDMGEPTDVWERNGVTTLTITNVTNATPMVVTTSAAHGLGTGALVEIYNVTGPIGVNQQWRITSASSTTFSLNGSTAGGAYTSGGTVIVGGEEDANPWQQLTKVDTLAGGAPQTFLEEYRWQNEQMKFRGATGTVELWIEYTSSGAAPQSGATGWDNCHNLFMMGTAGLAASAFGDPSADRWTAKAYGPSMMPDGTGGEMRSLLYPMLQETNFKPNRSRPFRDRLTGMGR